MSALVLTSGPSRCATGTFSPAWQGPTARKRKPSSRYPSSCLKGTVAELLAWFSTCRSEAVDNPPS
eukprot:5667693-Pyramimonas_sp.AAC.1